MSTVRYFHREIRKMYKNFDCKKDTLYGITFQVIIALLTPLTI